MDPELLARLDQMEAKIDLARVAAEKTRNYLFWTGVVTIALIVLPAIGLAVVAPQFLNSYTQTLQGIGY